MSDTMTIDGERTTRSAAMPDRQVWIGARRPARALLYHEPTTPVGDEQIRVILAYLLEAGAVFGLVAQAVWSLLLLRLDFEKRWYKAASAGRFRRRRGCRTKVCDRARS